MARQKSGQTKAHEQAKEAKENFVPSDPNADYLKSPSQKKEIAQLALVELKDAIELEYADGMRHAQTATECMIACGKHLLKAREKFKGDKEFGRWRKEALTISASHVTRLMSVAREFGDNTDAKLLPIGTLAELVPASPAIKQEVIEKAAKGEKVTRQDVKDAKKEEKAESAPPPEVEKATKPVTVNTRPGPGKTLDDWERAQIMLDKNVWQRLDQLDPRESDNPQIDAFILFCIPPYCEGMPSRDTIGYLYEVVSDKIDDPDTLDKLQQSYDIIMEMY